jgi:pantetheine-phosphate adenylyltransferase
MGAMAAALYPGSFDPLTLGHLDLIQRACRLFSPLVVAVGVNSAKQATFSAAERMDLIREAMGHPLQGVQVESFSGLVVDYARERGIPVLIRGLRTPSDFESELSMAQTNRCLNPEVETVFLPCSPQYSFLSSRLIREIASQGGDLGQLVPEVVERALHQRLANRGDA